MQNVLSFLNSRVCRRRLLRRRFFDSARRKWIRMEWNGPRVGMERCVEIARRYVDVKYFGERSWCQGLHEYHFQTLYISFMMSNVCTLFRCVGTIHEHLHHYLHNLQLSLINIFLIKKYLRIVFKVYFILWIIPLKHRPMKKTKLETA